MSRKKIVIEPVNFEQALCAAAHDMRGGVTALSALMAANYNTLVNKLNIKNNSHNLKPSEIEQILLITEDQRIVEALARLLGLIVFKSEVVAASNQSLEAASKLLADMSGFLNALASGAADHQWEDHEVMVLEKKGFALIARLLGVIEGARKACEGGDDE